jgi:hypothetical protein
MRRKRHPHRRLGGDTGCERRCGSDRLAEDGGARNGGLEQYGPPDGPARSRS